MGTIYVTKEIADKNDPIQGTDAYDVVSYRDATSKVKATLLPKGVNTGVDDYGTLGWAADKVYQKVEGLEGSQYGDALIGDANANILNGLDGDDTIHGMGGADTIDGGSGDDTVSYVYYKTGGVTVNLGSPQYKITSTADAVFQNVENAIGSDFDDVLIGNDGDNRLDGGKGNDLLIGGKGADLLNGGDGIDTVSYQFSDGPIVASIDYAPDVPYPTTGESKSATSNYHDTIDGSVENIIGSSFNDFIEGSETYKGAEAYRNNNLLDGGAGNDTLVGLGGADTLNGGNDFDFANYHIGDYGTSGVQVNLLGGPNHGGNAEGDVLQSIEGIIGTRFADTITGNGEINVLEGGEGNDIIYGGGGNDTIRGGDGDDVIHVGAGAAYIEGGAGNDTYYVSDSNTVINDTAGFDTLIAMGDYRLSDKAVGIDTLIIGGAASDDLYGNKYNNVLTGNGSANKIYGLAGNDKLLGGAGNDSLYGGLGNDTLTGGTGKDSFFFGDKTQKSNIDTITDFGKGDRLVFQDSIFTKLKNKKASEKAPKHFGKDKFALDFAKDGNDHFIVKDKNKKDKYVEIFYDKNGNAAGGEVQIAKINKSGLKYFMDNAFVI